MMVGAVRSIKETLILTTQLSLLINRSSGVTREMHFPTSGLVLTKYLARLGWPGCLSDFQTQIVKSLKLPAFIGTGGAGGQNVSSI